MKPRNKAERAVVEAHRKLPALTAEQIQWGFANCFEHIGRRIKKGIISCTVCGHEWNDKNAVAESSCPNCETLLKIEDTLKRTFYDYQYLCVLTTCEGYQVLRFIYMEWTGKAGYKGEYSYTEAVQRWIAPDGTDYTFARLRPMGCFVHGWSYCSHMELRNTNDDKYNIIPTKVYPKQKIIPELKKRGFKGSFDGISPYRLFHLLLTNNRHETLFKTRNAPLMLLFIKDRWRNIENYWPSIRIAIRNGYKIKDASLWCDYIDALRYLGKDLRNARYVCPSDLHTAHDIYMKKKNALKEKRDKEEEQRMMLENEANYKKAKERFFGLTFADGQLLVRVIESVEEMIAEGNALRHCVSGYHDKKDSLILSATVNGKRTETVEVSLSNLAIIQCRGVCNKTTKHHDQILKLVNANLPKIQQRMSA